jgi:hypothetical protein
MAVEGARTWNPIISAKVRLTTLALHGAHTECGVWVHIDRAHRARGVCLSRKPGRG